MMDSNLQYLREAIAEVEKLGGDVQLVVDLDGFEIPIRGVGVKMCGSCTPDHPVIVFQTRAKLAPIGIVPGDELPV